MLEAMGSFGSGILSNLLSDSLGKKFDFIQNLREWEIEFEKQNDGTVITNSEFFSYVKNFNAIENIVDYVLEPNGNSVTEDVFLNSLKEEMVRRIEEVTKKKLSLTDKDLIRDFLAYLFAATKNFLVEKVSLEDRGLLYMICQNNVKIEGLVRTISEKFQMQDDYIQKIAEQLSRVTEKIEIKEHIKEKVSSWNSRQIKNLGDRYTPELNIPVEIMDSLHGASVDKQFKNSFFDRIDSFLISMRRANLGDIYKCCDNIEKYVTELNFFDFSLSDVTSTVSDIINFLTSKLEECYKISKGKKNIESKAYLLSECLGDANDFLDYLTNTTVKVAASPYIVLTGDGGVGKSHLIADFISSCDSLGQTALLLLGQQFSAGMDVLASLPILLGCNVTYHKLFDIFEEIAHTQGSRVLICIDALNEGAGVAFWNGVLSGVVDFLKGYSHVGLLVSVRKQYEEPLFDRQEILRTQMQRVEHFGFNDIEHKAMYQYLSFYGVTLDSVIFPLSELRNPLFLRLFCIANKNAHISLGETSLPSIYSKYIDVIEQKVSERCNYNKSYRLVSKIIDKMVSKRFDEHNGAIMLSLDETLSEIVDICKKWNVTADVYGALLAEGVLAQGYTYDNVEYVYITYERLEDFYLAQKIASEYSQLSRERFIEKYSWILRRPDILQYFGIILSEDYGRELRDAFFCEKEENTYFMTEAFAYV